ncbi:multidrug efflux pump subunit AcrA (membrane-fusion protein) [Rhodopseudomonas rhenobacensis]|uniref:Multidrug efflux pump subunit AcrA (Membrane-fusion protein) n=1 Tax=Rhodopseudomonas rhenobacensis TaxID=87461 RepID=A0A7W7Z5E0_9BRAD|nr:efflux RND transporter periplasmic adaptor subunit [Rhodopseudomonas rhenobacensis]MBB5048325.1 multidrug efflux pump subunit AcrA (membrane-fusion protein) [Rhodopseudomonas rhenobacensis]
MLSALLCLSAVARANAQADQPAATAQVIVARAGNACFSDMVRVTGFVVPRREAVVVADQEGSRVTEILVREGDSVTENQELIRLTGAKSLRAPAAGLVTQIATQVGAPASPQAGPMLRIAVKGEVELDVEVPGIHALKLSPGAPARISRDDGADLVGKVRLAAPQLDRATQLGHVRLSLSNTQDLKVGTFARATIDARRSCGVAIPRTAVDRLAVQVVKGNVVETRKVRVGLTSDSSIEILEGLKEGDLVVADAGTSLHDGDTIKPLLADDLERTRVR